MIVEMSEQYPREFDARRVLPLLPNISAKGMVQSDSIIPMGLDADGRLIVGVLESCTDDVLDKAVFLSNRELNVVVVSEEAMAYAIHRYVLYNAGGSAEDYLRGLEGRDETQM